MTKLLTNSEKESERQEEVADKAGNDDLRKFIRQKQLENQILMKISAKLEDKDFQEKNHK
jgi:hypothetical protein